MKKYIVYFDTTSGDYDKCWVSARNEQEAIEQVKHEYWNVARITHVSEA